MHEGFLSFNGVEIWNGARAAAYLRAFLPAVEVRCDFEGLAAALGHSEYTDPGRDLAPWFKGDRPASARFYGVFPSSVQGAEDSTRAVEVTPLTGSGSAITSPRYNGREIRFKGTAFAADEEAMEEGMAWLRTVLAAEGCGGTSLGCAGHPLQLFAAAPTDPVAAYDLARTFHLTEVTEGPLVARKLRSGNGVKWELEWTVTCGRPWAFTNTHEVGGVALDTGSNFQDPDGENCAAAIDGYDDFIDDPFFPAISRPPRPPIILPPNILAIHSWRRSTIEIPDVHSDQWGKIAPVVTVATENAVSHLRLRFYQDGASGCDFDGEFYISYIPGTAVLTLDTITQTATVRLWDGREVPAGNLLFGSDGRPALWPDLGCQAGYWLAADLMPGQPGVYVALDVAVRL